MNIPVWTSSGKVIVRPDTTWKRDDDSCWMPDFVSEVSWTPVQFVNISRLGKSINGKFADRYYDAIGFGFFLYPENLIDGTPEGFACASCLDHTTFLSYPQVFLKDFKEDFRVLQDGTEIFRSPVLPAEEICKAISEVSSRCLVRRGDLLAIELCERRALASRPGAHIRLQTTTDTLILNDIEIVL